MPCVPRVLPGEGSVPTYAVGRTCLFLAMLRCMRTLLAGAEPGCLRSFPGGSGVPPASAERDPRCVGDVGRALNPPVRPEASGAAVAGPEPRRLASLALARPAILCPFGSPLGGTFPEPNPVGWKAQTPRLVFMCDLCFFSVAPIFGKFLKEFCCSLPAEDPGGSGSLHPTSPSMSPVLPPQRGIGGAELGDTRRGNFYNCRKR